MNKHLFAVFVFALALGTKPACAQAHKGVPVAHTPVHPAAHVSPRVLRDYEEFVDGNPFLDVTGVPTWTRQNGLLVARVDATNDLLQPGVAVLRFKPQGGLVLFDFTADEGFEDEW